MTPGRPTTPKPLEGLDMTIQMIPQGTPSQQASAEAHFSRRDEWQFVRISGTRYVVLPSATSGHVYTVRADGAACSCRWYASGHAVCAHMLAIRLDLAECAAIEVAHQEAIAAWIEEFEPSVATGAAYRKLFPSCRAAGCSESPEMGELDCSAHVLCEAF